MDDTIKLLKECDSGSKMAVSAIEEVMPYVSNEEIKNILEESKRKHTKFGNDIHECLDRLNEDDKEPNPIAKSMSWLKINMKMNTLGDDSAVADLMTDGCNMGIKSLYKYKNKYPNADDRTKKLTDDLIGIENDMLKAFRKYL